MEIQQRKREEVRAISILKMKHVAFVSIWGRKYDGDFQSFPYCAGIWFLDGAVRSEERLKVDCGKDDFIEKKKKLFFIQVRTNLILTDFNLPLSTIRYRFDTTVKINMMETWKQGIIKYSKIKYIILLFIFTRTFLWIPNLVILLLLIFVWILSQRPPTVCFIS